MQANNKQIGGNHYKEATIEPWDAVLDWKLGYLDGSAIKYIARWRKKGGVQDLQKAIHFLEKLIEVETQDAKISNEKHPTDVAPQQQFHWDLEDVIKTWQQQRAAEDAIRAQLS